MTHSVPRWAVAALGSEFFFDAVGVEIHGHQRLAEMAQGTASSVDVGVQISALESLRKLILDGGCASDKILAVLYKLADLEELRLLDAGAVTDEGISHLRGLKHLKVLHLTNSRITDESLRVIQELSSLETLILDGNRITDRGLVYLRGLVNLTELSLHNARVTSEGLKCLESLNKLDFLFLDGTRADTTNIERALPSCYVAPSTLQRDENTARYLSTEGLRRLVQRMINLCDAPIADSAFRPQRTALIGFANRLLRSPNGGDRPVDEWYRELTTLLEPRDVSTRLRLSAAGLELADRSVETIRELAQRAEAQGLTAAEADLYTDELRRNEFLLDDTAEYLGLITGTAPCLWRPIVVDLCERTRPHEQKPLTRATDGPKLIAPEQRTMRPPNIDAVPLRLPFNAD